MKNYGTATRRQRWALFCATKKDYRDVDLSKEKASEMIKEANEKRNYNGNGNKNLKKIFNSAHRIALAVGNDHKPIPMGVAQHENPLDDNSKIEKAWIVNSGVCGFAWIHFSFKKNAKLVNFCKANEEFLSTFNLHFHKNYHSGFDISVSSFGQSYEKKMEYASAFSCELNKQDFDTRPDGRLD